jgi:hypothetical protein
MKVVIILLSIVAFIACLIIGIQAGGRPLSATPTPAPQAQNNWSSSDQQRTIVLIIADDLMAVAPRLISTWIVLYRPNLPRITFLPLYPPNTVTLIENPPDLAGTFVLGLDKTPSEAFANSLRKYKFDWNGYILTDYVGVAQTIDWLGGIQLNNNPLDGSSALSSLVNPWEDPMGALQSQQGLLSNVCAKVSTLKAEANWLELAGKLMPQHLHTSISLEAAIIDWKSLASGSESIYCEAPIQ